MQGKSKGGSTALKERGVSYYKDLYEFQSAVIMNLEPLRCNIFENNYFHLE